MVFFSILHYYDVNHELTHSYSEDIEHKGEQPVQLLHQIKKESSLMNVVYVSLTALKTSHNFVIRKYFLVRRH